MHVLAPQDHMCLFWGSEYLFFLWGGGASVYIGPQFLFEFYITGFMSPYNFYSCIYVKCRENVVVISYTRQSRIYFNIKSYKQN